MRIKRTNKKIDYSTSIVSLYNHQHDISNILNEADELELEANRLAEAATQKRNFALQQTNKMIAIANQHYSLERLQNLLDASKEEPYKLVIIDIISTYKSNNSHTDSTISQLMDIDPEMLGYIKQNYALNHLGKFDVFITSLKTGRK